MLAATRRSPRVQTYVSQVNPGTLFFTAFDPKDAYSSSCAASRASKSGPRLRSRRACQDTPDRFLVSRRTGRRAFPLTCVRGAPTGQLQTALHLGNPAGRNRGWTNGENPRCRLLDFRVCLHRFAFHSISMEDSGLHGKVPHPRDEYRPWSSTGSRASRTAAPGSCLSPIRRRP